MYYIHRKHFICFLKPDGEGNQRELVLEHFSRQSQMCTGFLLGDLRCTCALTDHTSGRISPESILYPRDGPGVITCILYKVHQAPQYLTAPLFIGFKTR